MFRSKKSLILSFMGEEKIQIGTKVVGLDEKLTPENEDYVYGYLMEILTGGALSE